MTGLGARFVQRRVARGAQHVRVRRDALLTLQLGDSLLAACEAVLAPLHVACVGVIRESGVVWVAVKTVRPNIRV